MEYADFVYYRDTYHGDVIQDPDAFQMVSVLAGAYLDRYTVGKIAEVSNAVKNAFCAAAEVFFQQAAASSSRIAGESVGNHSVTYSVRSDSDWETLLSRKVRMFLAPTGLLYGGLR